MTFGFLDNMAGPYSAFLGPEEKKRALLQGISGFGDAILSQGYSPVPRGMFQGLGAGASGFTSAFNDALKQGVGMQELTRKRDREAGQDRRAEEQLGLSKNADTRAETQFGRTEGEAVRMMDAGQKLAQAIKEAPPGADLLSLPSVIGALAELKPIAPLDLAVKKLSAGGDYSKSPLYATGPSGELGVFQLGSRGQPLQTQLPSGWKPADQFSPLDLGPGYGPFSRRTGTIGGAPAVPPAMPNAGAAPQIGDRRAASGRPPTDMPPMPPMQPGYIPKDLRTAERQKQAGEEEGKREGQLPVLKSKAQSALESLDSQHKIVTDEIRVATGQIKNNPMLAAGLVGGLTRAIPGTPAFALKQRIETIKANIGFDKLQTMRDNSPTGGALGQVSDFENRALQSVFGSLEQAQTAEDILYNLRRLEDVLKQGGQSRRDAFSRDFGGGSADLESLLKKYGQ